MNIFNFLKKRFQIIEENNINGTNDIKLFEDDQQGNQQGNQGRKISDEQAQQIAQGLQQGQITEDEIQQALQNGQMTEEDIMAVQQFLNQVNDDPDETQFEQELNKISDSIIRLNFYDRIQNLQQKIQNIIDLNTKVDTEKFQHIYDYLDILLALVYTIDVNILYQLFIALEIKTIQYIKEELGLNTDEEKRLQISLEIEGEKEDLKQKYPVEKLIETFTLYLSNQLQDDDKKQFEKDIEKLIALKIYTPEQIEEFKQQAQQQAQAAEQQAQDQGQAQPDDAQVEQAAQAIVNGEASQEELQQMLQNGQITQDVHDKILNRVQQLQQQGQGQQQPQQNQAQSEQPQPQDQSQQPDQAQAQQQQAQPEQSQQPDQAQAQQQQAQQPEQPQAVNVDDIALAIYNGEMNADELINAFKNNEITKEEFETIILKIEELKQQQPQSEQPEQGQPQQQQDQSQDQAQAQPEINQQQIEQAAQSIINGESSIEELDNLLQTNQITQDVYQAIIQRLNELSQDNQYQNNIQNVQNNA